ncbi:MAG: hypothetical protein HY826_02440 [Actinobacteria bacterium]|nr:hypothetical protein [Actinomycetota bacterium]
MSNDDDTTEGFDGEHRFELNGDELTTSAPAVLVVLDEDWWRKLVAQLDDVGIDKLLAGELRYTAFADDGVASLPLVPPQWLRDEIESEL